MLLLVTINRWLQSRKVLLLLFLVLAVGSWLRIYDLGAESLWLDEATSENFSKGSVTSIITESGHARNNPPLYWIMLHYWMGWFGNSEAGIRSLSAVFGIGAILVTYLVGKELFSSKVGLFAAFFSAISHFHIYYAQEARNYALLLFLSLLSYLFFIKILKQDRKWYYPCYFLASLFLGYTHIYGFFIIAAQIFYFVLFWGKYRVQRYKLIATLVAIIVSLAPVAILLGPKTIKLIERGFFKPQPTLSTLLETLVWYAGHGLKQYNRLPFALLFFPLALLSLFSIRRKEGKWVPRKPIDSLGGTSFRIGFHSVDEVLLLLLWLALPIIIPFTISQLTTPFYSIRYTIGASPALYLLMARGISTLEMKKLLYPVLIVIIVLSGLGLHDYYVSSVKPEWREAVSLIEMSSKENDVIVLCPPFIRGEFEYYYREDLPVFEISAKAELAEVAAFVDSVTEGKDRLWLVMRLAGVKALPQSYLKETYGITSIVLEEHLERVRLLLVDLSIENTQ